jgi:SAM-dependent methyltransferase
MKIPYIYYILFYQIVYNSRKKKNERHRSGEPRESAVMKIKADWFAWLHSYKQREIDKTFSACPDRCFAVGLEIGAGDGFQSVLLSRYICRLLGTEINKQQLSRETGDRIEYRICSAEEAVGKSEDGSFDIVYSSNLLEHLADPVVVLRGIHRILKDDGITIHIMPSSLWKLCHMLLYVPVNAVAIGQHIASKRGAGGRFPEALFMLRQLFEGLSTGSNTLIELADREEEMTGNNPGIIRRRTAFLKRLLVPRPHGISQNNLAEFSAFRKRRWIGVFKEAGLECRAVRKGPAASGYGLGWSWAEAAVEKAGLASELIYIAHKKGRRCRYLSYFL